VLADALDRHGPAPVGVRTATDKLHCYYWNTGEARLIRPWGKRRPIDVLGDGYAVAPALAIGVPQKVAGEAGAVDPDTPG
jgi:hypothetical protein